MRTMSTLMSAPDATGSFSSTNRTKENVHVFYQQVDPSQTVNEMNQ
jgi:hypothetical protein